MLPIFPSIFHLHCVRPCWRGSIFSSRFFPVVPFSSTSHLVQFAQGCRRFAIEVMTFRMVLRVDGPELRSLECIVGICRQNDDNSGGVMLTDTATIHPSSLLAHLCRHDPLTTAAGKTLLRQIPFRRWDGQMGQHVSTTATLVSVDNGNDAFKGAMLHAYLPTLSTRRIITAYAPAEVLRAGEGIPTWQVDDSEPFWIGEDALLMSRAESLPIGMTEERLPDERYQRFLFACLVELLREAGYEAPDRDWQGEYHLYLSFGLPNEEITRNGVKDTVHRALERVFNISHEIRRINEQGKLSTWKLRLVEVNPYPQTFGSFVTWYYTLDGTPIETDIVKHVTLDIGGGQLHTCTVTIEPQGEGRPRLRMQAALLDEGTIAIARAVREQLRAQHSGLRLSDTEAQQVLMSGYVKLGGRRTPVSDLASEVIRSRSQRVLTHMRHLLQEDQTFLMFTGGGRILLGESLHALVRTKRSGQSFLFVPKDLASVLNAIGGYVLAQALAQKHIQTSTELPR
jgi:hypothetical protein